MSKNDHDLSSMSIMEQIQHLIKPPPNEEEKIGTRQSNSKHPYYKRPGRGHNHDLCDACDEGGDLLCCDRCPASFHLLCHDPPLTEEDIPAGQWVCHRCRMHSKPLSKACSAERGSSVAIVSANSKSENSRPNTPSGVGEFDAIPLKIRNLRKRSSSRTSLSSDVSSTEKFLHKLPFAIQRALDPNKKPTPLDDLIKQACFLNPKQFELPKELEIHTKFPGNDKVQPVVRPNGNGSKKCNVRRSSKPYEIDSQGLVPLPAKTCFYCSKSCRKSPLIACDYCPLLFHPDCLNPPLTTFPTGLWMCPNHVENFVDSNLCKTISATERVRLWNKFSQPIDHEAVKMEFFRRVNMRNPPFRVKVPAQPRDHVDIPSMVRYHYSNRPHLLPSLRETLRYSHVKQRKNLPSTPEDISKETVAESLAKDLAALQNAAEKVREVERELGIVGDTLEFEQSTDEPIEIDDNEMEKIEENSTFPKNLRKRPVVEEIIQPMHMYETTTGIEVIEDQSLVGSYSEQYSLDDNIEIVEEMNEINEEQSKEREQLFKAQIDKELMHLDVNLIKKLAFQRLQQLVAENPDIVAQYQNRCAPSNIRQMFSQNGTDNMQFLPSSVIPSEDIRKFSILFTHEKCTTLAKPHQEAENDFPQIHPVLATAAALMVAEDEVNKYVPPEQTEGEKGFEIASRLELKINELNVRARAILTPLGDILEDNRWFSDVELDSSFFMRYRSFSIGNGCSPNDVNLTKYGECARVSPKHATIFYDEFSKTYELINYSEYGTEVNGLLYICDFMERDSTLAATRKDEEVELHKRICEIIDKRRGIQRPPEIEEIPEKMCPPPKPNCKCSLIPKPPMIPGAYEGTAVLSHGSIIRFGCLAFVFCIPEVDD